MGDLFREIANYNDKNPLPCFSVMNYCDTGKRVGNKEKNQRGYIYILGETKKGETILIGNLVILENIEPI
jgi:hypothetical protein